VLKKTMRPDPMLAAHRQGEPGAAAGGASRTCGAVDLQLVLVGGSRWRSTQ
jgi:hypothetical protein